MKITASLALVLAIVSGAPDRALAMELGDGKLSVSGFGEWGFGQTRGGENRYLIGNTDGRYDNASLALSFIAKPDEDLIVASQIFLQNEGEAGIDWAFVEWRPALPFRVRMGKIKQPLGAFMEVQDVGTLRPFFTLPQSIYGPANVGAEAYLGAGLTGDVRLGAGYALGWDVYGGAIDMPVFEPFEIGHQPLPWTFPEIESERATEVVGGRLTLATPIDGLTFRLSGYTGILHEEDLDRRARQGVGGVTAEYLCDRLTLRGELFYRDEGGFERAYAGYLEAATFVSEHVQLALRAEASKTDVDDVEHASTLTRHDELAAGVNYWFSPSVVMKLSYHLVHGNRFAAPESSQDGILATRTHLFVAGTQFSF
jgi:hypothetical protein